MRTGDAGLAACALAILLVSIARSPPAAQRRRPAHARSGLRGVPCKGVVTSALAASGLAAGRLELEITESVLLERSEANVATLHRLRALGVRIALDDFGTGYSSLGYLRSFPFDKIKIDRSFVRELGDSSDCLAIVRAVAGLGASLGICTTAEGVETEAQLDRIRAEGCTEAQGFLMSRPVPAGEVMRFLAAAPPQAAPSPRRSSVLSTLPYSFFGRASTKW